MPENDDIAPGVDPTVRASQARDLDAGRQDTVPHAPAPTAYTRGQRIGRYDVVEKLDAGGMGVVYRARDPKLDRDVAIKIVESPLRHQDELLGEARAMAKLSHSSIVPIFDVGRLEAGAYMVMPLVRGGTLHSWLNAHRRPWRSVLALFIKAGHGLAAAHAAGIVHRDFKPTNVLLDGDEVLVADFGISAFVATEEVASHSAEGKRPVLAVGTPGYSAPELATDVPATATADQYSFCASLREALHGTAANSPSGAQTVDALPRWLTEAIARGLSNEPAARWPSMTALLTHLESRSKRAKRVALGVGATLLAVCGGMAIAFTLKGAQEPDCPDGSRTLGAVWNPDAKLAVQSAFDGTKLGYAQGLGALVVKELDARATRWKEAHLATCRAGRASKASNALVDMRTGCLDRWLKELDGTLALLRSVKDRGSLEVAADASREMSRAEACMDDDLTKRPVPPPEKRSQAVAIEDDVLSVELARRGRQTNDLEERVTRIVERARALSYEPSLASSLRLQIAVYHDVEKLPEEKLALQELTRVAAAAGDDDLSAWAWTQLVVTTGLNRQPEEAVSLIPAARAAVTRAGDSPKLRARLLKNEAMVIDDRGQADQALALLVEAEKVLVAHGAQNPGSDLAEDLQAITVALGAAQGAKGDYAASEATFRRALSIGEQLRGADHPAMAKLHANLGETLRRAERFEDALAEFETSRRITEAGVGEGPQLTRSSAMVAGTLFRLGKNEESLAEYDRTLGMAERVMRSDDPYLFKIVGDRAEVLREVGQLDAAMKEMNRVSAFHETRDPTIHDFAIGLMNRGGLHRDMKQFDEAVADFTRAISIMETPQKGNRRGLVNALVGLGLTHILRGHPALAIEPLEKAANDSTPGRRLDIQRAARWLHGRALVESRKERAKGMLEVKEARLQIEAAGDTKALAELDAWLATQ